jgi:hypothetical protein
MMTGPEHYRPSRATAGERYEEGKGDLELEIVISDDHPGTIAAARVHAVLALAAATALDSDSWEWLDVAGSKLSS